MRLTQIGRDIKLVDDKRYDRYMYKKEKVQELIKELDERIISPEDEKFKSYMNERGESYSKHSGVLLSHLLKRPGFTYDDLRDITDLPELDDDIKTQLQTSIRYEGYIQKQLKQVEAFHDLEDKRLRRDFDYSTISGLRLEARAKLNDIKPENIGQAARISGVSPSDVTVLLINYNLMSE